MRNVVAVWFLLTLTAAVPARTGTSVEVIINKVRNDKGVLMVGLFNSDKTFMVEPLKGEKPRAQAGTMRVVFQDVPPGVYAVSAYHDMNENGNLDTGNFGKPREGVGFSNNVMGKFGPPTFDQASFKCPVTGPLTINLKYY